MMKILKKLWLIKYQKYIVNIANLGLQTVANNRVVNQMVADADL